MPSATPLLRVGVLNDFPIVVVGLAHVLAQHDARIEVVELDAQAPVPHNVDIVLCDAFARTADIGPSLAELVDHSQAQVVLFSGDLTAPVIASALEAGVVHYISKRVSPDELVGALEAIHRGEAHALPSLALRSMLDDGAPDFGNWPGRDFGLTAREAEIVAYIASGHTNVAIAEALFLSINSVKTHIRSAYRKMGVTRRTQAVLWALGNGFVSDSMRLVEPPVGTSRLQRGY